MRPIDADEAKRFAAECWPNPVYRLAIDGLLDSCPTIDPKDLQPHGRWERVIPSKSAAKWCRSVSCSVCHTEGYKRYNYCPNCGAKMDEEARP